MNSETGWLNVTRILWIDGGLVAVNMPGPDVQIVAGQEGPELSKLRISSYPSLIDELQNLGLSVVGVTFVEGIDEALGLHRPQFRALSNGRGWLAHEIHQQWRQIAHASSRQDNMKLMDIASRIASGIAYSEMRLQDLVVAYSVQLRGLAHKNIIEQYKRFKDTNSPSVFKAIHALFWEMAVLRDTLSEFAAMYCFQLDQVTSLNKLISILKQSQSTDSLTKLFLEAADESKQGWLAVFSTYRNLFTHSAPMEQVAGIAFAIQEKFSLSNGLSIPRIYYPLPANVMKLRAQRSNGLLFKTFEELIETSSHRHHDRRIEPDALEYLRVCLDQFVQISALLTDRSPIEPQPIRIQPSEIVGEIPVYRRQ